MITCTGRLLWTIIAFAGNKLTHIGNMDHPPAEYTDRGADEAVFAYPSPLYVLKLLRACSFLFLSPYLVQYTHQNHLCSGTPFSPSVHSHPLAFTRF